MRLLRSRSRMRGFTAVEMMIVVLIVGIITAIAAPNMAQMIRNQRVKTTSFDLFSSLTFARSEAVKRNLAVTITPTVAGNWLQGWQVRDSNNELLKEESDRKLNASELTVAGPANVTFARTGRLTGVAAPQFSLAATSGSSTFARCIRVDLSGRPVSSEVACP